MFIIKMPVQHLAKVKKMKEKKTKNQFFALYSRRLEIPEAGYGSSATQGGCAGPKAAVHTGYGMTLIELMLVLTIMMIIAALTLQFSTGVLGNYRLRQASDDVRAEWGRLRSKAMQDGQIYCFRCKFGSDQFHVDRLLDPHFSAGFLKPDSQMSNPNDPNAERTVDPDNLTQEDYFFPDPESVSPPTILTEPLPKDCFFADAYVKPNIREKYYEGTNNYSFGGADWSNPILFYPDGSTSTATLLVKNTQGKCIELYLRGLTGTTNISDPGSEATYQGQLNASTAKNSN